MNIEKQRLTDVEQHSLLAVWRLGKNAHGTQIRNELAIHTGRTLSVSAIYVTLVRLEDRGLVTSTMGTPAPVRGGKAKRFFRISTNGVTALKAVRREMETLWNGLDKTAEWSLS